MDLQSFLRNKGFILVALLAICLVAGILYQADSLTNKSSDNRLSQAAPSTMTNNVNNEQEATIFEIRDKLFDMQNDINAQLTRVEELSQKNSQDIADLKRQQAELGNEIVTDISTEGDEQYDIDPDYKQEQDAIMAEARQAAYISMVDNYFASQSENVSWTAEVESELQTAFEGYPGRIQLNDVSCGDAMCKVSANIIETGNDPNETTPPFDQIIHGNAKWPGQSMYKMDMDTGEVTLYLMREGVGLPQEEDGKI